MKGLLIGPAGVGKTTLCNALIGVTERPHPTQMFRMIGNLMDTPSIYLETPSLYHALIVVAQQVDVVFLVVDVQRQGYPIPPGFAQCFFKPVYGIITKIDLPQTEPNEEHVRQVLVQAGAVPPFWRVSSNTKEGLDTLRDWLRAPSPQ